MRVRTGRFERLRLGKSGHSDLVGPGDCEDGIEEHPAVAPPATGVSRYPLGYIGFGPQGRQFPEDRPTALPLFELDGPQAMAHPFVQLSPDAGRLRQPEVGPPSQYEGTQPLRYHVHRASRYTGRQFTDTVLELSNRFQP